MEVLRMLISSVRAANAIVFSISGHSSGLAGLG